MTPQELKARIRGVLAFAPTPFTPEDSVDLPGLAQQVDFLCRSGAHVVVVCGGVGEFFSLEYDEYCACIRTAVEAADRRVPLVVGIGHSTRVAARLARHAAAMGADGLMINPLYFIEPSEEGMLQHYQTLAQAANLGLIVFSTKGAVYTPTMLERLTSIDAVVAFKDEFGDLKLFSEAVERLGDRLAWINGMAEPLAGPYFAAGAQAFTSGLVNIAPQVSLAIWEAGSAARWDELQQLVTAKVRPIARLRERRKGYHIAVIKEAMNLLGMPGGAVRSPVMPLTPADRDDLWHALAQLGLSRPISVA